MPIVFVFVCVFCVIINDNLLVVLQWNLLFTCKKKILIMVNL